MSLCSTARPTICPLYRIFAVSPNCSSSCPLLPQPPLQELPYRFLFLCPVLGFSQPFFLISQCDPTFVVFFDICLFGSLPRVSFPLCKASVRSVSNTFPPLVPRPLLVMCSPVWPLFSVPFFLFRLHRLDHTLFLLWFLCPVDFTVPLFLAFSLKRFFVLFCGPTPCLYGPCAPASLTMDPSAHPPSPLIPISPPSVSL